jgi:dTDP-4-dehydrorhamnose 3,5-epimerase
MRFRPGTIEGLWVIEIEPVVDHRGFFARSWCRDEFADHGLVTDWAQSNLQFSPQPGTMRGLHYQRPPYEEIKLVRCTRGAIYDVAADLRPDSPSYLQWFGVELRADEHTSLWIPKGCAHGYVTLEPDTEATYLASHEYAPEAVGGIRYDDPTFGIAWPRPVQVIPADYESWPFYELSRAVDWGWPVPSSSQVSPGESMRIGP